MLHYIFDYKHLHDRHNQILKMASTYCLKSRKYSLAFWQSLLIIPGGKHFRNFETITRANNDFYRRTCKMVVNSGVNLLHKMI